MRGVKLRKPHVFDLASMYIKDFKLVTMIYLIIAPGWML